MNQLSEVAAEGQVRIAGAVIRDNARQEAGESVLSQNWEVLTKKNAQGQLIAFGFNVSQ